MITGVVGEGTSRASGISIFTVNVTITIITLAVTCKMEEDRSRH